MGNPCEDLKKRQKAAKEMKKSHQSKKQSPPTTPTESNSRPVLEFPHILRIIGPKHVKIAMQFVPSAVIYSVASLVAITYMCDWKTVLQYLPYYNGKYYDEESSEKKQKDEEE